MSICFRFVLIPVLGIFLFFFCSTARIASASNLSDGLVGYYPFNGNTNDESGNGNNGINYGAVLTSDKFANNSSAYEFTRINDANGDFIQIPINISPNVMSKMTVVAWAKQEKHSEDGGSQVVISNDDYGWDRAMFSWYDFGWGLVSEEGLVGYHPVSMGEWYFLVGIYDHVTGLVKLQVNNEIYTGSGYPGIGTSITNIGRTSHDTAYYDGIIDEVRIYDRILSDEEIGELYDQFKGEEEAGEDFSFAHMTDVHLGSSWVPGHKWSEESSYPRFTDGLYEISKLAEKPDFILVSGDVVEYADVDWLKDYKSITNSFTAQTGVEVHTVPGNHDRFRGATGSFFCQIGDPNDCNDGLSAYKENILPLSDEYFTHKGVQFIGLDSGADFLPDYEKKDLKGDKGIESEGLTNGQMADLGAMDATTPKVAYMHSPVFSGGQDKYGNGYLEDASIANNREEFLDWAASSNLQLALTGHTHRDEVYDFNDYQYHDIYNAENPPLFIQTQSVTKDSSKNHGYRIINVAEGEINPQAAAETAEYDKLAYALESELGFEFRVFDPDEPDDYIGMEDADGLSVPFFTADGSDKAFLYDFNDKFSKVQIVRKPDSDWQYDLKMRYEGPSSGNEEEDDFGYYTDSWQKGMLNYHVEKKLAQVDLKNINIFGADRHQLSVDWEGLLASADVNSISFSRDLGNSGNFLPVENMTKMQDSIIAKLFSPAELVVINNAGERTGVVEHEPIEEIRQSLSDAERERVLVYFKEGYAGEKFIYRIQGVPDIYDSEEDEFGLEISFKINGQVEKSVNVRHMPISASTTYQFHVDWETLSATRGVMMEVDEDGDGLFEIKVEMGRLINAANPYNLREKMLDDLAGVKTGKKAVDERINAVMRGITMSMDKKLWKDDYHLDPKNGDKVFQADFLTVKSLRLFLGLDSILNDNKYVPEFVKERLLLPVAVRDVFKDVLSELLRSDLIMANVMINELSTVQDHKKYVMILKAVNGKILKAEESYKKNEAQAAQYCEQIWRMISSEMTAPKGQKNER